MQLKRGDSQGRIKNKTSGLIINRNREQAQARDQKWWKDDEKNGWKAARVEDSLNAPRFIKVIIRGT